MKDLVKLHYESRLNTANASTSYAKLIYGSFHIVAPYEASNELPKQFIELLALNTKCRVCNPPNQLRTFP